jgi:phage-related protein
MAPVLPGVFELRNEDSDFWYRVLYRQIGGIVYVLHCFRKKTNKTSPNDIKIARERLSALKERLIEWKGTGAKGSSFQGPKRTETGASLNVT